MKGKKLGIILLAVMLAIGTAGCNSKNVSSSTAKPTSKLSIWSWGSGAEKDSRDAIVKVFIKEHPEIKVTEVILPTANGVWDQKSAAAFAAGNAGDVMQTSPDYYGLMSKYYEDLNPYVKKDGVDLKTVMTSGLLDGYYDPNGKLEGMPLLANCFQFAYNKDMFDKLGVKYPTDDWTWDDFAAMASKFVSGQGVNHTYFVGNHWVLPNFALICKGGIPYTSDLKTTIVGSKEVAEGLDLFGKLVKEGAMPNDVAAKNMPGEQSFVSGKAAIYPMGGFEMGSISKEIGSSFKWGAVLPPKDSPTGKNTNITYATGYAMNAASKNKAAAWLFIKEASYQNVNMAKLTSTIGMPANKKIANSVFSTIIYGNNVSNAKFVKGMTTSRLNIWGGALATAGDLWTQMWQTVTINGKTGAQAQAKYVPLIQQAFKELDIKR